MSGRTTIRGLFDPKTWTVTYVVWDRVGLHAAVIDPVLDYDFKSGHTGTTSADEVLAYLADHHLRVDWILETHAHADHLSGAHHLQQRVGGGSPSARTSVRCRRPSRSSTTSSEASCPMAANSITC